MTPAETAGLTFADVIDVVLRTGPLIAAAGIWWFGFAMRAQNKERAAQADEDRKVTQAMLAALTELIRRTSPPSSQAGPRPGPAG